MFALNLEEVYLEVVVTTAVMVAEVEQKVELAETVAGPVRTTLRIHRIPNLFRLATPLRRRPKPCHPE